MSAVPFARPSLPGTASCRRGMALVIVLCALFLLSTIIFGLAQRVNQEMYLTGRDNRSLEARALAYSGVQIALHPQSTIRTPAMRRQIDAGHRYEARLAGEGGKLNLNWLLAGEDPSRLTLLQQYLAVRGLTFQDQQTLVDCLLDFVSPNSTTHPNGTKTGADGQPVPGRPFKDLSEVHRVAHSAPLTSLPGWDADFTLLSQGPVDLQWAGEAVVAALPGVGLSRAKTFVQQRAGPDRIDGTADDIQFAVVGDAEALLSLNVAQNPAIQSLVGLNDVTVRIISVGQAIDTRRTIEVVARKQSMQPQILQWKEY